MVSKIKISGYYFLEEKILNISVIFFKENHTLLASTCETMKLLTTKEKK